MLTLRGIELGAAVSHMCEGEHRCEWLTGNGYHHPGRHAICMAGWQSVFENLSLSQRESEIVQALFDDQSEQEIADGLGISRHTVHTHVERLYRKVDVTSRVQLIIHVFATFRALCRLRSDDHSDTCPLC